MESILRSKRQYNIDHQILKSENKVIERMLKRSVEMKDMYNELGTKLSECQQEHFWDAILGAATFFNPESSERLRKNRKTLVKLNQDIAKYASKLTDLMKQRYDLSETSGLNSHGDHHVIHWIERAAKNNYLYQSYVKVKLKPLASRFDLKYWPRTFEVVSAISAFAEEAETHASDEWTEELLSSQKCSKSDYLRVLLKAIEDKKEFGPNTHVLPHNFCMTDKSLATMINGTLGLEPDNMITTEYVKGTRQNIRDKQRLDLEFRWTD